MMIVAIVYIGIYFMHVGNSRQIHSFCVAEMVNEHATARS